MRVSAVLSQAGGRWLAQCEEVDRAGEGATAEEAVASLREALDDYFGKAEAMAPPPQRVPAALEIVVLDPAAPTSRTRVRR
jgi:hypothetical protein